MFTTITVIIYIFPNTFTKHKAGHNSQVELSGQMCPVLARFSLLNLGHTEDLPYLHLAQIQISMSRSLPIIWPTK